MNSRNSFKNKLIKLVVFSILSVFIIGQVTQIYIKYSAAKNNLYEKIDNTISILSSSLAEAIWDYDNDQIEAIGNSIFVNDEILRLKIEDNQKGVVYEKEREIFLDSVNNIHINKIIIKNDTDIGQFSLVYTNSLLISQLINDILQELIIIILVIIVVLIVISRTIIKLTGPLQKLGEIAVNITDHLDEDITLQGNTIEVSSLINSLNNMKLKIKHYTDELEFLNVSLEEKVEIRTNELNESNSKLLFTIKELENANKELELASKIKLTRKLVAGVAHEINTPLGNAIMLSSYLESEFNNLKNTIIKDKDNISDQLHNQMNSFDSSFSKLEISLRELVKLIDQFKALNISLDNNIYKEVNLNELISKSVRLITKSHKEKIILNIECNDSISFSTRPILIIELLRQLIDNTIIHAYDENSEIKVLISCKENTDTVTIDYIDYGRGIDSGFIKNAFMPFAKEQRMTPGAGLGLAIVENLVVMGLNGSINCSSIKNKETHFKITLNKTHHF